MKSYVLKNVTVVELFPPVVERADIRIADGKIVARKRTLRPKPGERVVDLSGKIVMPGMVCAHTHLYSALARGMPPPQQPPRNFLEILQKVWWKLDRALDREGVYYSALIGAIESALAGTTTLVDHQASPGYLRGSLATIREALERVGLRAILCYEVTDRGGRKERDLGLEENREFIAATQTDPLLRGLVGAHASFTLDDDALRACAELAQTFDRGVHIHLAEDPCDEQDARQNYGRSVVERLQATGVLTRRAVLAHGTHLTNESLQIIKEAGSWLVHNPRSNMNNAVGYAPVAQFGARAALGTDGISGNMFDEVKTAFFKARDGGSEISAMDCLRLLTSGHKLVSETFGQEIGRVRENSVADLIILDYQTPTPLTVDNLVGHVLFGMSGAQVESVMVAGRFIVKDRTLPGLDLEQIYHKAQQVAQKLWARL
jgi:putative selenium metabolism protein SsnA